MYPKQTKHAMQCRAVACDRSHICMRAGLWQKVQYLEPMVRFRLHSCRRVFSNLQNGVPIHRHSAGAAGYGYRTGASGGAGLSHRSRKRLYQCYGDTSAPSARQQYPGPPPGQ